MRLIKPDCNTKGFTLLELIVVIIIVGILASLGFIQYSKQVEYSRLAEAKTTIGLMRNRAYEFYLKNGTLTGISQNDLGVDNTCDSSHYYRYGLGTGSGQYILMSTRCTSGGKAPDTDRAYWFGVRLWPDFTEAYWFCAYTDTYEGCFGLTN